MSIFHYTCDAQNYLANKLINLTPSAASPIGPQKGPASYPKVPLKKDNVTVSDQQSFKGQCDNK